MFQFIYAEAILLHMYTLKCNSFLLTQISCDGKDAKRFERKAHSLFTKDFLQPHSSSKISKNGNQLISDILKCEDYFLFV